MTEVETNPSSRHNYVVSLPDFVGDNVMAAGPNNDRCLVTNNPLPTQLCHCVWRKAMDDDNLLDSLEWAWDMKRYRLNLDTRYNLFYADISTHFLFNHLGWLLLPEQHIIETYYNALALVSGVAIPQRGSFPVIENSIFDYHFVPLQGLEGTPITRIDSVQTECIPVLSTTTHTCPFKTLPIIKSHLHPKFAIVNAGEKMQTLSATNIKDFKRVLLDFPILRVVLDVHMASPNWDDESFDVPPVPPLDLIGSCSGSNDGDNDGDSDYDNRTNSCRPRPRNRMNLLQGSPVRKRRRTEPTPWASGSKRKVTAYANGTRKAIA